MLAAEAPMRHSQVIEGSDGRATQAQWAERDINEVDRMADTHTCKHWHLAPHLQEGPRTGGGDCARAHTHTHTHMQALAPGTSPARCPRRAEEMGSCCCSRGPTAAAATAAPLQLPPPIPLANQQAAPIAACP
eukprot:1157216-Pelagomonas_calceolata.AAC.8